MTRLDQFTLAAVPLELFFDERPLSHATGFIWELVGRYYLVTNWHVLTGRNFFTGSNLDSVNGCRPNRLKALFNTKLGFFDKQLWEIPIYDEDGSPLWLVRTVGKADVVVLPLQVSPEHPVTAFQPINRLTDAIIPLQIGMEVFILGFPFGIAPPGYPIWKRGSIASEPELVRLTDDYLLVDTASRPGMSGAPVIRRNWDDRSGTTTPHTRFVGIYSGRLTTQTMDEAQIGLVWDPALINEIIAGDTRDT